MGKTSALFLLVPAIVGFSIQGAYAAHHKPAGELKITRPANGAVVKNPVEICFEIKGLKAEPAKKGVHEGTGHHHILIDMDVPKNLGKPLGKPKNVKHMGDGSACKSIELSKGRHTLRGLFANGKHVPYDPPVTDSVTVTVE